TVLLTDEPVVLSRSISIANQKPLVQQESLPFIRVHLNEEFQSLIGKKVELHGHLTKPFDFFLLSDVEFDADTALDVNWQQTHQTRTVLYEPNITELKGTLYQKTYPGPPEYSSVEAGDTPETVLILALTEPVDVQPADAKEEPFNQPEIGVREVHISFFDSEPPEELWNQEIIVQGTLFSAHTGHHHRRVVMSANTWEIAGNSTSTSTMQ